MIAWTLVILVGLGPGNKDLSLCTPSFPCPNHVVVVSGFDGESRCEAAAAALGGKWHRCFPTKEIAP